MDGIEGASQGVGAIHGTKSGTSMLARFMKRHRVVKLVFHSVGGHFSSYLCETVDMHSEGGPASESSHSRKLLNVVKLRRDAYKKAQSRLLQLKQLGDAHIEPLLESFHTNGQLYLVSRFMDQGGSDLYRLAHLRQTFSEADLGSIASQLLSQLSHLHGNGLVYKYLKPHHLVITHGFTVLESIKIKIADIAPVQMLDFVKAGISHSKDVDKIFIAPELLNG